MNATSSDSPKKPVAAKWGSAVADGGYGSGWTPVPSALIHNIGRLGLSSTDVTVLLSILVHWWIPETMPSPRVSTIARRLGVSNRTVERAINRLEQLDLLIWEESRETPRGRQREFNLTPLKERVTELSIHDRLWFEENRKRPPVPIGNSDNPFNKGTSSVAHWESADE